MPSRGRSALNEFAEQFQRAAPSSRAGGRRPVTWGARVALVAVVGYQRLVSPALGPHCRFAPTCSEYARLALGEHGAMRGTWLAVRRVLRCHPFHPGGYDPPPARYP